MNRRLSFYSFLLLTALFIVSCKKNKTVPPPTYSKCPIISIETPKEKVKTFEWVSNRLVRMYLKDSIETSVVFKYNTKNLVDIMEIQSLKSLEKYVVKFTYNEKNQVVKSNTSLSGFEFMSNDFLYNTDGNISSINTTVDFFGQKVKGKTRLLYTNKNVSKVYSSIDNESETLSFSGDAYDDKPQYLPDQYKIAAMGFVGLSNSYFSYFGNNNMTKCKIYYNGKLDQETNIAYLYDNKGLPKQSESVTTRTGDKTVEIYGYSFGCK
jgi:hypothetical protein